MHDFLDTAATMPRPVAPRYRRPDTYGAAARLLGLSRTHVFQIIAGTRRTTPANVKALLQWAHQNAAEGRAAAPAVAEALINLSPSSNKSAA